MVGINGSAAAQPMEMESLQPPSSRDGTISHKPEPHLCDRVLLLLKLYVEYYPKLSSLIFFVLIGIFMVVIAPDFKAPVKRNRLSHDYSNISNHYNFKASQMDHWCLWGGDDDCHCLDFTEPEPRTNVKGWLQKHEENKKKLKDADPDRPYDVVFVGDEMVERMVGNIALPGKATTGVQSMETKRIAKLFEKTFTKKGGANYEGLALGIGGDAASNTIWRLQHGEMPNNLFANVYWLWIGVNDLVMGGCSEEAVVLGILRTAEEISWHDPDAVVVVQGILPLSMHGGTLDGAAGATSMFHKNSPVHSVSKARKRYLFWPSIQAINKELEKFCTAHPRMVYFDAGDLFTGNMGNSVYRQSSKTIMHELMPDYIHPSLKGYQVLFQAMKGEIDRIMLDDNEKNDIETKGEQDH